MQNRPPHPAWPQVSETLRDGLAQLHDAGHTFDEFVSNELERLDALRLQLEERDRTLAMREAALSSGEESLEIQRRRLEQLRMTAEQSARQVQNEARRLRESEELPVFETQNNVGRLPLGPEELRWARQRRRLVTQLDAVRQRLAQMSGLAIDLANSNRELAEAQKKIAKLQHRLVQQKGHFEPSMRQRLELLEMERDLLSADLRRTQTELDGMRNARESDWLAELARLRALFERKLTTIAANEGLAPAEDVSADSLDGLIQQLIELQTELDGSTAAPKDRTCRAETSLKGQRLNGQRTSFDENE